MIKANYHTHTNYCHGEGNMELYVQRAIENNLSAIGFSSHAPVSFNSDWHMKHSKINDYLAEISFLKNKYKGKIEIYTGFEVDYIKDLITPSDFRNNNVDFLIGSVHYVGKFRNGKNNCIDNSPEEFENGLKLIFNNNIQDLVEAYYNNIIQMIQNNPPDILGHLDLIKKLNDGNRFFNENDKWYREIVQKVLEVISNSNCIIEINTRGYYKGITKEVYPSKWILSKCLEYKIPVTISTDAHHPREINKGFTEAVTMLLNIGYKNIKILMGGKWSNVRLEQL